MVQNKGGTKEGSQGSKDIRKEIREANNRGEKRDR